MNDSYDLIVVGAGTAGIPAALAAAERGLRVALVEAGQDVGGTLHLSSASISAAGTSLQAAHGVDDDPDTHFRDCQRINHGTGDPALLRRWVDEAPAAIEWLRAIGWTCVDDAPVFAYEHDLYDRPRTYRSSRQGHSLIDAFRPQLARAVAEHALDIRLATRFHGYAMNGDRVAGIVAEHDGAETMLTARAVIVTTGGFSGSARHWQAIHGRVPLRYHIDTVVGDAIDATRAIGGALWFEDYMLPAFGGTRISGSSASAWIHSFLLPTIRPAWEVYVNTLGERFLREDEPSIDARERAIMAQPEWSFWAIYDQAIRDTAPPLFRWDRATQDAFFAGPEVDFVKADTLAELAARCDLPEAALLRTIDRYNRGQAAGSDMWRRTHLPRAIGTGPFYAVRHYGCSISSYPGLRVNEDLQVRRADGSVIEGLYAAGEVIGIGFLGHSFLSGSIVSSAVAFGRRLGQTVLA